MTRICKNIITSIALLLTLLPATMIAGNTTVTAKIDSVAILMGKQTRLHYQIVQDKGVEGTFVSDNPQLAGPNVEIIGEPHNDTTDLGNNRIQIDRTLIVQSFDSGIWEIPAAKYMVGRDTIFSNALNLKVVPVNVDSMTIVHGYKGTADVPFNLFDYLPDFIYYYWWILVLVLALAAVGYYLYQRHKNGKPMLKSQKKEIPPFDEAIEALNSLKAAKLWQNGQEKEYFTRLTDILRRYIDRRFGINAVEMTSSQIIDTLRRNEETKAVNEQLKLILEVADFVKFANMRPLPDDSEAAWNRAQYFVNETKPVEVVADEQQAEGNGEAAKAEATAQQAKNQTNATK